MRLPQVYRAALFAFASLLIVVLGDVEVTAQTGSSQAVKNIVIVHGAWVDGSSWSKVISLLQAKGFHVVAVQNPLTSFADDVAATRRVIALQDGPVLLVGHSYGGVVITEAGNDPKVVGLVYVAAFAPSDGESINSVAKNYPPAPLGGELRPDAQGFLSVTPKGVAEDIAQESFLAAVRALDRFDRRRPFGPWLHRIVVNRAIDWSRARGARQESDLDGDRPAPERRPEIGDELVAALAELSPEHRAVIVLRHLFGYTPGEIAEQLDLPRGTVNSRLRRGLDDLEELLR